MTTSESLVFSNRRYEQIEGAVRQFLDQQPDFISLASSSSPRAVGDAIQQLLGDEFEKLLGSDICSSCSADFARRAMADIAFEDKNGLYYRVDVKTHRLSTAFNMPNLTSAKRLVQFYEDDKNFFVVLLVSYACTGTKVSVDKVTFVPIEHFDWECLTLGALGWGQIQIADAKNVKLRREYSRKSWMVELCTSMLDFYPREIAKIESRVKYFESAKARWEAK